MYICIWRYPVDFAVHYNIHYITFTILVRETWNDYQNRLRCAAKIIHIKKLRNHNVLRPNIFIYEFSAILDLWPLSI